MATKGQIQTLLDECRAKRDALQAELDKTKTDLANTKSQLADCQAGAKPPPVEPPPVVTPPPSSSQTIVYPWKSTSLWLRPLPANPEVLPDSTTRVQALIAAGAQPKALSNGDYGVPIVEANAATSKFTVEQDPSYKSQGYPFFVNNAGPVPIPAGARPAPGSDAHLCVVDIGQHKFWDMWKARYDTAANKWIAGMGISGSLDGDGIPSAPNYGATSANLPLLGGLIRPEEIQAGVINHRLSYCSNVRQSVHVYPATKHGCMSGCSGPITEGSLLQLNMTEAEIDALSIPAWNKIVCHALRRFGAYHRDGGGSTTIFGETEANARPGRPSWASVGVAGSWPGLSSSIPWNRLRVLAPTPANN